MSTQKYFSYLGISILQPEVDMLIKDKYMENIYVLRSKVFMFKSFFFPFYTNLVELSWMWCVGMVVAGCGCECGCEWVCVGGRWGGGCGGGVGVWVCLQ